jgi:phage-related protein
MTQEVALKNRGSTHLHLQQALALVALAVMLWAGAPARGQNTSPTNPPAGGQNMPAWDNDITREELANMDRFLDSHPEIAEQLQKNPSLINNKEWLASHPQLVEFLQSHPGVREEFSENPAAFMRRENIFDRHEDARFGDRDITREELANMDRFLDSHPEIAEQLSKNPSLINNKEWLASHPQLVEFLQQHPGVREEFRENPVAFMRAEERFDRHEDERFGDRDRDDRTPAAFGRFLNDHSVLAEELSKNPSLVNNKEWMARHPELQEFLQSHPGVTAELTKNPVAFMSALAPPNAPPVGAPPTNVPPAGVPPATQPPTNVPPAGVPPATQPPPTAPPRTMPPQPKPPGQ